MLKSKKKIPDIEDIIYSDFSIKENSRLKTNSTAIIMDFSSLDKNIKSFDVEWFDIEKSSSKIKKLKSILQKIFIHKK